MGSNPDTKKRINDALLELMMSTDADKITAIDLASKAGISRATLYRYYNSIEDVLEEVVDEFLEGMRDCSRYYISAPFNPNRLDEPYPQFVDVARYILENEKPYLALTGPHGDGRFVHTWRKFVKEFYSGKLAYEGMGRINVDLYIEFVLAGSDAMVRYWLEKRRDLSPEEVAPIAQRILYGPFTC